MGVHLCEEHNEPGGEVNLKREWINPAHQDVPTEWIGQNYEVYSNERTVPGNSGMCKRLQKLTFDSTNI